MNNYKDLENVIISTHKFKNMISVLNCVFLVVGIFTLAWLLYRIGSKLDNLKGLLWSRRMNVASSTVPQPKLYLPSPPHVNDDNRQY